MNEEYIDLLAAKLEIIIITYNRSCLLINTLEQLKNSPFLNCKITVLDNCSTDNTFESANKMTIYFPKFNVLRNKINIGGNANIIRAVELSESKYTWVLCDDDKYDFSDCNDVIDAIINEKYNLIHMGAHEEYWKFGATSLTPKQLVNMGYPYFKYSSFLPCNLFRTELFYSSIIEAYSNIANWYPHIPFLIEFYNRDEIIYVAKKRVVTAVIGNQEYNNIQLIDNWFNCSLYLTNKKEKLIFQLNQGLSVNSQRKMSFSKIIISYGINSLYNKNILSILRLLAVTNFYQSILLILSILISPVWFVKRKNIFKNLVVNNQK